MFKGEIQTQLDSVCMCVCVCDTKTGEAFQVDQAYNINTIKNIFNELCRSS